MTLSVANGSGFCSKESARVNLGMKIVGIVLVRNEDRFVEQAVRNARSFCDSMILADHGSTDHTPAILERLAQELDCSFHRLGHPRESHDLLKPFAGSDSWVFGVDGDEIYDPAGLARLRSRLLAGEFARHWMILGNVLHCDLLDLSARTASGFLAPPSRSITKLFHFGAIDSWAGNTPERLHGGSPQFRQGWSASAKLLLQDEYTWDESPLRCLHACFLHRSSIDPTNNAPRLNIMETYGAGLGRRIQRKFASVLGWNSPRSNWKNERYRRGPRVSHPIDPFFP